MCVRQRTTIVLAHHCDTAFLLYIIHICHLFTELLFMFTIVESLHWFCVKVINNRVKFECCMALKWAEVYGCLLYAE